MNAGQNPPKNGGVNLTFCGFVHCPIQGRWESVSPKARFYAVIFERFLAVANIMRTGNDFRFRPNDRLTCRPEAAPLIRLARARPAKRLAKLALSDKLVVSGNFHNSAFRRKHFQLISLASSACFRQNFEILILPETIMKLLSNQQRLHLVNTEQLFENYQHALRQARPYRYGMRWKTVRKTEYLFRDKDRHGNGKSLGRRSPATEALLAAFTQGRVSAQDRLAKVTEQVGEQARLNKALRLGRVPRIVARVLRELDEAGLHADFTVIGTQAMYAYESAGASHFLLELLASGDVDLLYDARHKMTLASDKLDGNGLLGLLKKADKTFECVRQDSYRAANAGQFMVDLVIAPRGMRHTEPVTFSQADLVAAEVPGLQWLLNAPKLDAVAIDEDGWPVPIKVPDPRVFSLHKAWLSTLTTREPVKKRRDLAQAQAVAALVRAEMPQYTFDETLTSLHGDVRKMLPLLATGPTSARQEPSEE